MKRIVILSLFLLTVSLACQTIQRIGASTPSTDENREPIQCNDDSCLNACLNRLNRELKSLPMDEVGGGYAGTDSNFNLVKYQEVTETFTKK